MSANRRSNRAKIRLETLEDRITPGTVGPVLAHPAALPRAHGVSTKAEPPKALSKHGLHPSSGPTSIHRPEPPARPHGPKVHDPRRHHPSSPPAAGSSNPGGGAASPAPGAPSGSPTPNQGPNWSLPANVSQPLQIIYQEFEASGAQDSFASSLRGVISIEGDRVGVMVHGNGGDFGTLVTDMEDMGLQVDGTDATTQTVSGLLPIAALRCAAQDPLTLSVTPEYLPRASNL
jgi:hypothetical protein